MIIPQVFKLVATPTGSAIAYNKSRKANAIVKMSDDLTALFAGEPVVYAMARIKDGYLEIGDKVDDPKW